MSKKNELIKKNPAYGRMVCRCEQITEGEIVDVIGDVLVQQQLKVLKIDGGLEWENVREVFANQLSYRF